MEDRTIRGNAAGIGDDYLQGAGAFEPPVDPCAVGCIGDASTPAFRDFTRNPFRYLIGATVFYADNLNDLGHHHSVRCPDDVQEGAVTWEAPESFHTTRSGGRVDKVICFCGAAA